MQVETSIGPTVAATPALDLLGARNLANGAAQVARIAEVHGRDRGEGPGHDLLRIDLHAQRQAHQDGQLGARVESAHVFGGIGLGIAPGLRLGQHRGEFRALLHLAEDEVAGAVQNAFDALDAVAGHALFQAGNHGNSAGHRGAVFQMAALGRGQPLQFDAVVGDELFVGGDNALARFERAAHPGAGRIETAGQLHHHIHIGGQHGIGVFAPDHACGHPVHALPRHAAIETWVSSRPCGLDSTRMRATELPTVPKPKMAMRKGAPTRGLRACGRNVERRCGTVRFRHLNFPLHSFLM